MPRAGVTPEKTSIAPRTSASVASTCGISPVKARSAAAAGPLAVSRRTSATVSPIAASAERQHLVDQPVEREGREQLGRRRDAADRGEQHRLEDAEPGGHVAQDAEDERHREERQEGEDSRSSPTAAAPRERRPPPTVSRAVTATWRSIIPTPGSSIARPPRPGSSIRRPARVRRSPAVIRVASAAAAIQASETWTSGASVRTSPERAEGGGHGQAAAEREGDEGDHAGDLGRADPERRVIAQPDRAAAQRPEARGLGDRIGRHRTGGDAAPGLRVRRSPGRH